MGMFENYDITSWISSDHLLQAKFMQQYSKCKYRKLSATAKFTV